MKIAVLGASGFVGAHLVRHFGIHENTIDGYSRSPLLSSALSYCKWIYLDITNHDSLFQLSQTTYDVVIYSIADTNYTTTTQTIEQFKSVIDSIQTQHLIYISSSSIYMGQYGFLNEEMKPNIESLNNYAHNKHLEEQYLQQISQIQCISILRPRAIYGIGDRVLLYDLLTKSIFHRLPYLSGDTKITTSLTSINTLTEAIEYIISKNNSGLEIYNIADNQVYNLYKVREKLNTTFLHKKPLMLPGIKIIYGCGLINHNTYVGYQDIFGGDKVLDIKKIESIKFNSTHNFFDELPYIYERRKQHIGSISNMKYNKHNIPRMI